MKLSNSFMSLFIEADMGNGPKQYEVMEVCNHVAHANFVLAMHPDWRHICNDDKGNIYLAKMTACVNQVRGTLGFD